MNPVRTVGTWRGIKNSLGQSVRVDWKEARVTREPGLRIFQKKEMYL
ncbi:MAG: hypothetical protein RH862_08350 [Leptospiraceae bacterium]